MRLMRELQPRTKLAYGASLEVEVYITMRARPYRSGDRASDGVPGIWKKWEWEWKVVMMVVLYRLPVYNFARVSGGRTCVLVVAGMTREWKRTWRCLRALLVS